MTQLDWLIVAFASVLAIFGFRQGFIVGALSFCGFVVGAFLGTRLAGLALAQGSASPYAPAFGLFGALLGGAILASGLEGLGFRLRRILIVPGVGLLDGVLGAVLGAALALGIVWIAAAVAGQAS
ncbi:MAG TPA: CvpA family protein, partial [Solirubrobacteraceae bacterium]|nr:CvpA family protein [Solirubrobacteraceae bacterium]